jgi:hypothetical protein
VDDIIIDVAPTCLKPDALYTESTTTTSATIGWNENGSATSWNVEVVLEGQAPTGTANYVADSNPFEATGLDPATYYDFYVQSDCGDGDLSWWAGPETFFTQCVPFEVTLFEDFDDVVTPALPLCWVPLIESTSIYPTVTTIGWESYSSPTSLRLYNSDDPVASVIAVCPEMVDPANELWVNFFAFGYAPELIVGTITDPMDASTFTEIATLTLSFDWQEFEVFFDDYTGTDAYLAFKGGFGGWYQDIFIDNVTIDYPPTCPKPADLYAEDATQTSIMLGWTENGEATQWNIEYGYAGFTPTGLGNVVATENPVELTDLEDGTLYEFYVQADCGVGDQSYWVGPHPFQTLCYPTVLAENDYFEGFEDLTPPVLPPCIAFDNANYDEETWRTSFQNPYNGLSSMEIQWSGQPMDDWFFSAPLELIGGQTYNVVFYYSAYDWGTEKLEVKWGDAPNEDGMTSEAIFDDDNIQGAVYQEGTASFTPEEDGTYFVGWHGYSEQWMWYIFVDDIFIEWDNSLVVSATADPDTICQGAEAQLNGGAVGGSGNYTYSWTSDPPGFTSNEANPVVSPDVTTDYILEVNDSFVSIFDTVTVYVTALPGVPGAPSGITFFCASWGTGTYSTSGATGANWYDWVVEPEDAGTLTGTGTSVSIDWTEGWLGMATLKVIGMHNECAGPESSGLNINVYLPDVTLDPFGTVGLNWAPFELTGGLPAGGVYSGPGVDDDGYFDPMVAGLGVHTITYTYSDAAACENYAEETIEVIEYVGINNFAADMQVAINPNPNNGVFTLTVKAPSTEKVNIKVMNNFGEEVYTKDDVELHANYSAKIDLSTYAEGLYYLYIYSDNVNYIEKIVIK